MDESENTRMATIEEQRDNWKESARFHLKNEEYYRKERDALQAELHAERNQQQRTIATKCLSVMEKNERLREGVEEVRDLMQDFAHTDDHTARHAARALLAALLHPELYAPDGLTPLHAGQADGDPVAIHFTDDSDSDHAPPDGDVSAPIVLSTAQTRGEYPLPQIVQAEDATTKELRDVLAFFVCHWPASYDKDELFDQMFSRAMTLTGILPGADASDGLSPLSAYPRACAATWESEQAWNDAIDAQSLVEFDLPIWCWEATATYDRTFGDGPCTTEQPLCGPDQPLPF